MSTIVYTYSCAKISFMNAIYIKREPIEEEWIWNVKQSLQGTLQCHISGMLTSDFGS